MATAELVLLTPLALVVLSFLVIAGRLSTVRADIAAASRDAARAGSTAQTYDEAIAVANRTAAASLADQDVTCRDLRLTVGDPALFAPGGELTVTVACDVTLSDVALPGVPGTRTVEATSVEILDQWRSVG